MNFQVDGFVSVWMSHSSATSLYRKMPESEMSVLMPLDLMNAVESFSLMVARLSWSSVQAKQSKTSVRIKQGKEILKSLNLSVLKSFNPSMLLQFPLCEPAFVEGDA